jgi:hypothetical protein
MKRLRKHPPQSRPGSTLVLVLIFITMFSALAVAMASMSGANMQVAGNYVKLDRTRAAAESGLEVMRYWMNQVTMSGTIADSQRFSVLGTSLQGQLPANMVPAVTGTTITITDVPLDAEGRTFSAVLTKIDDSNVRLDVIGENGPISRTIRTNCFFQTRADTVFDFGVASKGPISLSGNVELSGVNINIESNAYIVSENDLLALSITGNSHIAGNVKIVNPLANVFLQGGHAGIGGDTGEAAMQHVEKGVAPTDFPEMNPQPFIDFANANGRPLTAGDDLAADATYVNLKIPAHMNPHFTGNTTLTGVIYIQQPNVVTFGGGVNITGLIVADGDPTDDSGTNQIDFQGNVTSHPVTSLPAGAQYDFVREQTGTFMMAPGVRATFGGSFSTPLCGAIAANGIEFYGNAGGTIYGSVVNYSDTDMVLSGNSDLLFNRSGLVEVPAGFVPRIILRYDPSSYAEVL